MTKHTHEEYLAVIDRVIEYLNEIERDNEKILPHGAIARASLLANRAVLVRHDLIYFDGKNTNGGETYDPFWHCKECGHRSTGKIYCPTYTDVTNPLDEVMGNNGK